MMMNQDILIALGLTMIAGLSTGIGSLIAFFAKRTNTRFLSAALGVSAGVMIYVSFMELMPESVELLKELYSEKTATLYMLLAFFAGIAMIAIIDRLVLRNVLCRANYMLEGETRGIQFPKQVFQINNTQQVVQSSGGNRIYII